MQRTAPERDDGLDDAMIAMSPSDTEYRISAIPVDFDPFSEGELALMVPSTEAQKEIWLATQMGDAANCAFNESIGIRLRGFLNVTALNEAFQHLVRRHDALRSVLSPDGETLCVLAGAARGIPLLDLSAASLAERNERLGDVLLREVTTRFNLVEGPLFRSRLVKLADEEHCLVLTAHHIICDGWSWGVILSDFVEFYAASHQGTEPDLPPAESFSAFALGQRGQTAAQESMKARAYWLRALSGTIPLLDLPTDEPRPGLKTYNAARHDYRLGAGVLGDLKRLGAQHKCTLFTTLLAGFTVFLHRITQQRDVFVGITAAGQLSSGQSQLVGHCVNLLPLRTSIDSARSFRDYLPDLHRTLLDAYEHQQVTFGTLLKSFTPPRDPSRLPLLPVRFNLARDPGTRVIGTKGVEFEMFTNPRRFENFEFFLDAMETDGALSLECYYNTDLFSASTIRRRLAEFETLLQGIVVSPDRAMRSLSMLPDAEYELLSTYRQNSARQTQKLYIPSDAEVFVLDNYFQQMPIGVGGELYIASGPFEHLRHGYQQVKTMPDQLEMEPGRNVYKTGYLGCYTGTGDLRVWAKTQDRLRLSDLQPPLPPATAPDAIDLDLMEIWKRLLVVSHVNPCDNFFDLGGNSHAAMLLSRAIAQTFGQTLPLAVFFRAATIHQQADILRANCNTCAPATHGKAGR